MLLHIVVQYNAAAVNGPLSLSLDVLDLLWVCTI